MQPALGLFHRVRLGSVTTLILVRHGETDWNLDRRVQGSTDIPLNDTGRAQARAVAATLREALLDGAPAPTIVSSDLTRARETAEVIGAELEQPVSYIDPDLRERHFGDAEGLDIDEFFTRWGDWLQAKVPGAESPGELRARAVRALRRIDRTARRASAPAAATVIAVTHGALIREVLSHASGGDYPRLGERLANCASFTLRLERDWLSLRAWADGAFITPEPVPAP